MNELNYQYMTPLMVGALCQQLHPDADNEIEAVDIHSRYLYNIIQLKLKSNVAAADDIAVYFILCGIRRELLEAHYKQLIKNYDTNRNRD
ncbi:MAG: hypothetical protein M5U17_01810 [Ignavibacterium sp.]|nr:hypothetical protein [Ignavibacterium sp.]